MVLMMNLGLGGRKKQRGGQDDCNSCMMKGGKKCKMRHGGGRFQAGGATTPLTPASLSGVSFDQMGNQLARDAHNLYVQQNYDLAALKNVNAMKGGQNQTKIGCPLEGGRRSRRRTAKKYSRSKSRNKRSNKRTNKRSNKRSGKRGGKRGGGLVEAVVPLGLLAAQQTLFKRGSSKKYNKYGGARQLPLVDTA